MIDVEETDATCSVDDCGDPVVCGGMCLSHYGTTKDYRVGRRTPDGHLFDVLRARLNVFQESDGACVRSKGRCDLPICRYHLDESSTARARPGRTQSIIQDLSQPCALKLAANGGMTLEEVGYSNGLTRERIRQIEVSGLEKVRRGLERAGYSFDDVRECLVAAGKQ